MGNGPWGLLGAMEELDLASGVPPDPGERQRLS